MRITVLVVVVAAAACSGRAATPNPADTPVRSVPRLVLDVVVTDSQVYPRADLGTTYRYGSGEVRRDVYIYSKRSWPDPQSQANEFIETMPLFKRQGRYESYAVLANVPFNLTAANSVLPGHEVIVKLIGNNNDRDSYFAVVTLPDKYVKFRITHRPDPARIDRNFVAAWVEAYMNSGR
jgi:hypothetical protein